MNLKWFNTKQLVALWYGGILACLLLGAYAIVGQSILAAVLAILLLTGLVALLLGDHPNADAKRVHWWSFGLSAGLVVFAGVTFGLVQFLDDVKEKETDIFQLFARATDSEVTEFDAKDSAAALYFRRVLDQTFLAPADSATVVDYPAELSLVTIHRKPRLARARIGACVEVRGTISNEGSGVIKAVQFRVSVRDTLDNLLVDPDTAVTSVTVAPREQQSFDVGAELPCMTGTNRRYHVTLTEVRLRTPEDR